MQGLNNSPKATQLFTGDLGFSPGLFDTNDCVLNNFSQYFLCSNLLFKSIFIRLKIAIFLTVSSLYEKEA